MIRNRKCTSRIRRKHNSRKPSTWLEHWFHRSKTTHNYLFQFAKKLQPAILASCQNDEFEYMFFRKGYQAPTRDFLDSDSKVRFYTAGTLAGSTPMTEIFCKYLSVTRVSKVLACSESSWIPYDESPVLLLSFSLSGYSCSCWNNRAVIEKPLRVNGLLLA